MGGLVLPRGPLPRIVTNSIQSKFPYVAFSSNPCRLRYFTKEIVLVRHHNQLLETHSLLTPLEEYDRTHHTIKTLLDQGHLSPLPLPSQPIYWQFDHSLRLSQAFSQKQKLIQWRQRYPRQASDQVK